MQRFASFREFYPYYLSEHADRRCRRAHFIGSALVIVVIAASTMAAQPWWLLAAPVAGYGCAWFGHVRYEKNRPATFSHPLYSLIGDWVMFWQMLNGRIRF